MVSYATAPLAVDPYSRYMVDLYDEKNEIGVPSGFGAFFGRPETGGKTLFSPNASVVEIDIQRGNERIAALVPRGTISRPLGPTQKNLNLQKFTSFSRRFPLVEEEADISADQLEFRTAGENPYANQERIDRMRVLARQGHMEMFRRIGRLNEYLSSLSVLTGEQPAILGTTDDDLKYDFRRKSTHTFAAPTAWDASANIADDVDTGCNLIRRDAHMMPDGMLLGTKAMDAFIKDDEIRNVADNRRFELIEVSTNNPVPDKFSPFIAGGFIPRGRFRTPAGYELWLFTYLDVYTNDAGNPALYMPEDQALIFSSMARCDRYFGPPEVLPMIPMREQLYSQLFGFSAAAPPMPPKVADPGRTMNPAMFYCDAYVDNAWKTVTLRTQTAPIFATTATDAFVTITGLITP